MAAEAMDVRQLLSLAREKSEQARSHLFEVMGDLFTEQTSVLSAQERALMVDILEKLIREVSHEIRVKLSHRLADTPGTPHELAVLLANDEIDVASPILLRSRALNDLDLIEIIHNRSRQHLLAIAMRRDLSMSVSDVLVESGHTDVILALLANSDAAISQTTLAYVVEQSKSIDEFQEPLVRRKDLPRELAMRMCYWVSAAIRQFIIARFEVDETELDDAIEPILKSEVTTAHQESEPTGPSAAETLAHNLKDSGKLTTALIIQTLRRGEVALFESMLSEVCNLRLPLIRRFLYEQGGSGLAVVARALRLSREEFSTIFLLTRRAKPGQLAASGAELGRALNFFESVTYDRANRVLTHWRRDPQYLYAIRTVEQSAEATATNLPSGEEGKE